MAINATIKRWGNSFGIILPKEFVENQGFSENEVISLQIVKKADLTRSFGTIGRKAAGQEFKDLVRQGWKN
jgi:antitoxin component of MazEF toxin-antitoxin module